MKKVISLLAAFCLLLTMVSPSVRATTLEKPEMPKLPVQANHPDLRIVGLEKLEKEPVVLPNGVALFTDGYVSMEEAVIQVREQMMDRHTSIVVRVKTTSSDTNTIYQSILDAAFEHTGQPGAGDNLQWQWGWVSVGDGFDGYYSNGYYYYTLPYDITYYSNTAQEAELDAAVDALMEEWAYLENKSDVEKVDAIYGYITSNVVYDYEHLSDPNYDLMYTAYAAMIDGTAVCQGYANLFYRLALELGVDCRIITGYGWTGSEWGAHAWNLVEIDGLYYYVDSTWDASYAQAGWPYQWYLLGSNNFSIDHAYEPAWVDFLGDYPISATDYADGGSLPDPGPVQGTCGDNLTWSLSEDGVLTISGTGAMWDYPEEYPGWYPYVSRVKTCVIEEGVTSVGEYALYDCWALTSVEIPDSVTSIGEGAFAYCYGLTTVTIGTGVRSIGFAAFYDCTDLTDVYYDSTEAQWEQISIDEGNNCLVNANIHFSAGDPEVTAGDINGDGTVDNKDLTRLFQYLSSWDVEVTEDTLDINGDGSVDNKDLTRLFQHLSGWDVEIS